MLLLLIANLIILPVAISFFDDGTILISTFSFLIIFIQRSLHE